MKSKLPRLFILFVSILTGTQILFSQEAGVPLSSQELRDELNGIYGADPGLVNGKIYHPSPYGSISGHPFCLSDEWMEGQAELEGNLYTGLMLKYDIVKNELVLNTLNLNNTSLQIILNTGKISTFKLGDSQFVRYPGSENDGKPVFCELLSDGEVDYLLLRNKELRITSGGATDFEYKEYFNNYLYKDGKLSGFRGRRSLFKLFPEHKKEIRKYILQQGLFLDRKNVEDRAVLVDFCNEILSEQE
ncbi:MAG: hypothetical protein RQ743_13230 [Bacteroidales bacterium]|nr:hypothetical protein [Bacteroidales bacterium]